MIRIIFYNPKAVQRVWSRLLVGHSSETTKKRTIEIDDVYYEADLRSIKIGRMNTKGLNKNEIWNNLKKFLVDEEVFISDCENYTQYIKKVELNTLLKN